MNIIVAGCGKIGTAIISSLVSEGHDLVVVDNDSEVMKETTNIFDVIGVTGNCADCETLMEASVEAADLFIAVTGSDELNMLGCFIAKKMGAKHTVARIRNPEYNDESLGFMLKQLDLSMAINPEKLAAEELFDILKLPSAVKVEHFSRRFFEMIEIRLKEDSALDNMKISEIREKYDYKFLVCAVQRGDEAYIPDGNFVVKSGDRIGLLATSSEMLKLLKTWGLLTKKAKSVMILGGSTTAYYLAKRLTSIGISVKIIEQNIDRCNHLCEDLPKAVIICGDGAQQELLLEEGLRNADAFVTLTGMDEENILISFFASSQNVPKVISKVNRPELSRMAENMGLDCTVSPREIISDVIVRYARALENSKGSNVETLYKLMDGNVEACEFNVKADSEFLGIKLKDLNIKKNIIIAGIIRGRNPIIPSGEDMILKGDKVIALSSEHRLQDLSDIID